MEFASFWVFWVVQINVGSIDLSNEKSKVDFVNTEGRDFPLRQLIPISLLHHNFDKLGSDYVLYSLVRMTCPILSCFSQKNNNKMGSKVDVVIVHLVVATHMLMNDTLASFFSEYFELCYLTIYLLEGVFWM